MDHICKLCSKKVPCNGLAMCKHLKHSHSMQLEEYEVRCVTVLSIINASMVRGVKGGTNMTLDLLTLVICASYFDISLH